MAPISDKDAIFRSVPSTDQSLVLEVPLHGHPRLRLSRQHCLHKKCGVSDSRVGHHSKLTRLGVTLETRTIGAYLGPMWGPMWGPIWGLFGAYLGPMWGPIWAYLGPIWGLFGAYVGAYLGPLGGLLSGGLNQPKDSTPKAGAAGVLRRSSQLGQTKFQPEEILRQKESSRSVHGHP